jgi:hypothetical protein
MLSLPELVRIYVCLAPTDIRKSFDSLAALVREGLGYNPLSGGLHQGASPRTTRRTGNLKVSPPRFERGTFGSGGGRRNRRKSHVPRELRRQHTVTVLPVVLHCLPLIAALCRDLHSKASHVVRRSPRFSSPCRRKTLGRSRQCDRDASVGPLAETLDWPLRRLRHHPTGE